MLSRYVCVCRPNSFFHFHIILVQNAALWAGYFQTCKGAEFIGNKLSYKESPLLVHILKTVLVLTDSATYFQFQFLLVVCFYTVVELSEFRLSIRKFRQRITSKHTVYANELGTHAIPESC